MLSVLKYAVKTLHDDKTKLISWYFPVGILLKYIKCESSWYDNLTTANLNPLKSEKGKKVPNILPIHLCFVELDLGTIYPTALILSLSL